MMTPFGKEADTYFMNQALTQAKRAFAKDEVPVGAVVVSPQGNIIARGHNQVEKKHTQAAHAEVQALVKAGKKVADWRLEGHWLYVTLEPCAICMNLIYLSRLAGVIYGAKSPLFGYHHLDNNGSSSLYKRDAVMVIADICGQEAAQLLRTFFKEKRNKSG